MIISYFQVIDFDGQSHSERKYAAAILTTKPRITPKEVCKGMEKEVSIGIYEILLVDIPFLCEKEQ